MKQLKIFLILSLLFVIACEKDENTGGDILWRPEIVDKSISLKGDMKKFTDTTLSFLSSKLFEIYGQGQNEISIQYYVDKNGKLLYLQFFGNPTDKARKLNYAVSDTKYLDYVKQLDFIPAEAGGKKVNSFLLLNIVFNYDNNGKLSRDESLQLMEKEFSDAYTFVEQMPVYKGGTETLVKFIAGNIKYPEIAKRAGIQGKVMVQFVVDKNGKVQYPVVLKGIGAGCDEEAVRVIKMLADWEPGKQNGKIVNVKMVIPIQFRLN